MIAISYRREDSLPTAGRLYDRLQAKFGKKNVFMDFDSIPPGVDFREQIKRVIGQSNLVVAIIGPHWLGERADASRRIDNPTDFVRLEISYALKRGIPVIPVLIDNTQMPPPDKLPQEIEALAFRNAVELDTGIDFHHHADRLIAGIAKAMHAVPAPSGGESVAETTAPTAKTRLPGKIVAGSAVILVATALLVTWFLTRHRPTGEENRAMSRAVAVETPSPVKSQAKAVAASVTPAASAEVVARTPNPTAIPERTVSAATPTTQLAEGYDPDIASVDLNQIFKAYTKTKSDEAKINEAKNAAKIEYDSRADAYKKALDQINGLNRQLQSESLSASAKTAIAKERDEKIAAIKEMEKEINEFRTTREKQLQEQALRMREDILKVMTAEIRSDARRFKGFVFDRSGMSQNGVPVMLFAPISADMSGKVIAGLNERKSSLFATSHDLAFAVVDMNRIFKNYNKTKEAEVKINEAKSAAKKEYDDRADAYKKALDEINGLNKKLQSGSLSAIAKTAIAKERDDKIAAIKKMEKEINEFRQTREKQLQEQALRMREGIVREITDMIRAKLDRFAVAVVIDVSGESMGLFPVVPYVHGLPDYSDEVITALNGTGDGSSIKFTEPLVSANTMRFGLINLDQAFRSWPGTKEAEEKIADSKAAAQSESKNLSKAARDQKDKDLQEEAKKLRADILVKIRAALKDEATKQGFNLILDSGGKSLNGVPVVVFAAGLPDLTSDLPRN